MSEKNTREPTPKQKEAIEKSGVVCVLAGAGSGKTWVLSQRYLQLLKEKIKPREILALTFTEKAAWEMKSRVIKQALDGESLKGFIEPIDIELAPISTFHSFCLTLLRQNALELAIDPSFSVMTEVESDAIAYQTVDALIGEWRKDAGKRVKLEVIFNRLFSDDSDEPTRGFRDGIISIWKKLRSTGELSTILNELFENEIYWNRLFNISEFLNLDIDKFISVEIDEDKRGALADIFEKAGELSRLTDSEKSEPNWEPWEQAEIFGKIDNFIESLKPFTGTEKAKGARFKAAAVAFRIAGKFLSDTFGLLSDFIREFDVKLTKIKRELGVADFSDLECWTYEGLKDKKAGSFQKRLFGRYRYILVDELQDTSPIQMRILSELVGLSGRMPEFFGVGDFGQSIYGFRHAEPELFKIFADASKKSGARVELDVNFRSYQQILDWVGSVISGYFEALKDSKRASEKGWDSYRIDSYRPFFQTEVMANWGAAGEDKIPLEIVLVKAVKAQKTELEGDDSAEDFKSEETEAQIIAKRIAELVSSGEFRYGDIAVLFRRRASMVAYRSAFERRGIPVVEIAGSGFFEAAEVRDVYHLIRLLDNPYDSYDLACVLNSPLLSGSDEICGLSEDAILLLFAEASYRAKEPFDLILEKSWPHEIEDVDKEKLEKFVQLWREVETKRGAFPPDRIVVWLLKNSGYWGRAASDNPRRAYNLKKLFSILENLQVFGGQTFHSVWKALSEFIEGDVDEEMANVPMEIGDAVRLMTVHAAKGLEFPCVIVARCNSKVGRSSREKLEIFPSARSFNSSKDDILGVNNIDWNVAPELELDWLFKNKGFRELPEVENYFKTFVSNKSLREVLEGLRLLYVAMTRAEKKLIVAGAITSENKKPSYDSFLGMVWPALERQFETDGKDIKNWLASEKDEKAIFSDSGSKLGVVKLFSSKDVDKVVSEPRVIQPSADLTMDTSGQKEEIFPISMPQVISLTQLNRFIECPKKFCWEAMTGGLLVEEGRRKSGIEYGLLFHKAVAAWADFRFDEKLLPDVADKAVSEFSNKDEEIKTRLKVELEALAGSDVVSIVRGGDVEIFCERDLALSINGYILHGRPDLVIHCRDKKRVWVVDYKTDALGNMDEGAEKYRIQALGYGLAISKLFDGEDAGVCLYFTALAQLYRGYDLNVAEHELRVALEKLASAYKTFQFDSAPSDKLCLFCAYPNRAECRRNR